MHSITKIVWWLIIAVTMLTAGCTATGSQEVDFSGVWEGTIELEGMQMPGKMILDFENGKGSARFGFVDQLTQGSIGVVLDKEHELKGEGAADNMLFSIKGNFYKLQDEWAFSGTLTIEEGDEISYTTVEFYREGSAHIADLEANMQQVSPETFGNTIDFSGEWTGIQLLAEVSGPDAQQYKNMEGSTVDCRMLLNLQDFNTGTADLYFADELAGPALTAVAAYDRLTLTGTLWGDSFEWNGTFEHDTDLGEWTLTGGGDITGTTEDAVYHIVLSLNLSGTDGYGGQSQASEQDRNELSADASLEDFLIGSWMGPPSNAMVERKVLVLYYDGIIESYYATPGPDDTEATWLGGSWQLDEPARGTWHIDGNRLAASFDNDSISFETDVRVIDANSIEIEVFYTRSEYHRLPLS